MSKEAVFEKNRVWWKEIKDSMVHSISTEVKDQKVTVLVYGGFQFSFFRTDLEERVEYYLCKVGMVNSDCTCTTEIKRENGKYYWYIMGEHRCGRVTQALEVHGRENEISNSGHFKKSVTQTLDGGSAPGSGPPPPYLASQQELLRSTRVNSTMNEQNFPEKRFYDSQQPNRRNYSASNVQNVKMTRNYITSNDQQQRDIPNLRVNKRQPPEIFHNESGQPRQTPIRYNHGSFNPNQGNNNPFKFRNPYRHSGQYHRSHLGSDDSPFVVFPRGGGKATVHQQFRNQFQPQFHHSSGQRNNTQPRRQLRQPNVQYHHPKITRNSIHVSHLPDSWDDGQLFELFSPYGKILSAKANGRFSRGYGLVDYEKHEDALKAINSLNGLRFQVKFVNEEKKRGEKYRILREVGNETHNTINEQNLPQERIYESQQTNRGISVFSNVRNVKSTRDDRSLNDQQPRNIPNPRINKRQKHSNVQEDNLVRINGTENNPQQQADPRNPMRSQEYEVNETGQRLQKPVGYNPYTNYNPNQFGVSNTPDHHPEYKHHIQPQPIPSSGQREPNVQNPPSSDKSGYIVYVNQLPLSCSREKLLELFSRFGKILYAAVVTEISRCYGFVHFENQKDALKAICCMDCFKLEDKVLQVKLSGKMKDEKKGKNINIPNPKINEPEMTGKVQDHNSVNGNDTQNNLQHQAQSRNTMSSQEFGVNETGQRHQNPVVYNPYTTYNPNQGNNRHFNHSGQHYRNHHGFSSFAARGDVSRINQHPMHPPHHPNQQNMPQFQPQPTYRQGKGYNQQPQPQRPQVQHQFPRQHQPIYFQRNFPQRQQLNVVSRNPPNRNLFIFHLPKRWGERMLYEVFIRFGRIESVNVPIKSDGRNKGYGFVNFVNLEDAVEAIRRLNGLKVEGKILRMDFWKKKDRRKKK